MIAEIKPERPDLKKLKERAENEWGACAPHVLWLVYMLEKASKLLQIMDEYGEIEQLDDEGEVDWLAEYRGEDNDN